MVKEETGEASRGSLAFSWVGFSSEESSLSSLSSV